MQHVNVPETLVWTAPSHIQHRRSSSWYLFFALVSLGLISFAIYSKSILSLITFVLIIIVVLIMSSPSAKDITYKITKTGISIGNSSYPYKVIKKFWIVYNPPEVKVVNFETSAYVTNRVVMQLGNQNPVKVKLLLGKYLPEDLDKEESLSESIARSLKI